MKAILFISWAAQLVLCQPRATAQSLSQFPIDREIVAKSGPLPARCLVFAQVSLHSSVGVENAWTGGIDAEILKKRLPCLRRMTSGYDEEGDDPGDQIHRLLASYHQPGRKVSTNELSQMILSLEMRVSHDPCSAPNLVSEEIAANSDYACEIVKSAIKAADAGPVEVVEIIQAAILVVPEQMRMISQCAIAVAPSSLAAVQTLLAALDPNGGDANSAKIPISSKSAKGKVVSISAEEDLVQGLTQLKGNPLDRPVVAEVFPMPIFPPPVTRIDP